MVPGEIPGQGCESRMNQSQFSVNAKREATVMNEMIKLMDALASGSGAETARVLCGEVLL